MFTTGTVEYWHVDDLDRATPEVALPRLDQMVCRLVERLRVFETHPGMLA